MDERSIYMMLAQFKNKPFSFAVNYQGVDVIFDFWAERIVQTDIKFTVEGTIFMKNGAKFNGRLTLNVENGNQHIIIKGDRHKYSFTLLTDSLDYWNRFITEFKTSVQSNKV